MQSFPIYPPLRRPLRWQKRPKTGEGQEVAPRGVALPVVVPQGAATVLREHRAELPVTVLVGVTGEW